MIRADALQSKMDKMLAEQQPFDDWHNGYHQCLSDLRKEADSSENVQLMCRHCGLHVAETHYGYQHVRNQHTRPSCGKLLNKKDVGEFVL